MKYLALLRGVNVGGKNILPMAKLREVLEDTELNNVKTYIQSGNVIFDSDTRDKRKLEELIAKVIRENFEINADVVVYKQSEWQAVIDNAPSWWGKDSAWKHNIIVMIHPYEINDVVRAYGGLKPEIEEMKQGDGVLYQSLSLAKFGRTTGGKLAGGNPYYKQMTIRNFNTATKLAKLF